MNCKISNKLLHAKSYTSVYDTSDAMSYSNLIHNLGLEKSAKDRCSVFIAACRESAKLSIDYDNPVSKSTNYVTSEKHYLLKNDDSNCKAVVPSTSTIFYDLDDIAKRHSFNCLTEHGVSNPNFMKVMEPIPSIAYGGKSTAIVQECATQIQPKLVPRDSIEINSKKVKKKISKLSSEIFLRDDDYLYDYQKRSHYFKDMADRQQKFWSYAKYHTEYTKPVPEEKTKKDRGTADPCPCQLFSYACPCTDRKSLTVLTKNSKSLTVVNQLTSTTKINVGDKNDTKNSKSKKHNPVKEDKPTNTSIVEMIEVIVPNKNNEPPTHIANKSDEPIVIDKSDENKNVKNKLKPRKRSRKVLCPNCKENVDIVISISTTEEEENLKCENSSIYRSKEIPSTTAYAYRATPNSHKNNMEEGDLCLHEPRCELLPVCQILPNDNFYNVNQICPKKNSAPKSTPRIIRITKACRHHPPCTVVPSCQRANVLKNNCEFIPPCLHRPRCINLPLCVPYSKSLHYEETTNKIVDDREKECPHIPRCKYIPICQHESLTNTMDHQFKMVTQVQNACEFFNDYITPTFLVNPKSTCVTNTFSPCQITNPTSCCMDNLLSRSNKSCQFNSSNYKCSNESKENPSDETIIYIRDVGCQFKNKTYSPKNSVAHSKVSSNSFDYVDVKTGNYYTNVHTLRCEDKHTSPISRKERSVSLGSITSFELDSECPSHGRRLSRISRKHQPTTGFLSRSAYVAAYATLTQPQPHKYEVNKLDTFPIKSGRCFLKGKYRKIFSVKRRRKSVISDHVLINNCGSK